MTDVPADNCLKLFDQKSLKKRLNFTWKYVFHYINCFFFLEHDAEPCAEMHIQSTVVPLGSPVSATCVIRKHCPLVTGQAVQIEWRLGSRVVPGSPVANESDWVSRIVLSSLNHTEVVLTCRIKATSQIVAGKAIRAGCEKPFYFIFLWVLHVVISVIILALKLNEF